jgi:short-subunit dehydrogenase
MGQIPRHETGTALVTGASEGIGREIARVFASERFDVVLVARSRDRLEALASELASRHGVRAEAIALDLACADAPARLFADTQRRGIHVDVLVNNAGVLEFGSFVETPLERLAGMVGLNVAASTCLTRLYLEPMIVARHGHLLNVASTGAFLPLPSLAAYAATKAYILALSEALAEELRDTGVSVTACCPGLTDTEMVAKVQVVERLRGIVPSILFPLMDARSVAREAFDACMRGETVHVAGLTNRLAVSLLGSPHNPLVRWLGGAIGRRVM